MSEPPALAGPPAVDGAEASSAGEGEKIEVKLDEGEIRPTSGSIPEQRKRKNTTAHFRTHSVEIDLNDEESRKEVEHAFNQFDADGSGALDLKEIMAALRLLGINRTVREVREAVARYDTGGDRELDLEEFVQLLNDFGGIVPLQYREASMYVPEKTGYLERRNQVFGSSWTTVWAVLYGTRLETFDYKTDWYACVHGNDTRVPQQVSKHRIELKYKLKGQIVDAEVSDKVPRKGRRKEGEDEFEPNAFSVAVVNPKTKKRVEYVYRTIAVPDGSLPNNEVSMKTALRAADLGPVRSEPYSHRSEDGTYETFPEGTQPEQSHTDAYSLPLDENDLQWDLKEQWARWQLEGVKEDPISVKDIKEWEEKTPEEDPKGYQAKVQRLADIKAKLNKVDAEGWVRQIRHTLEARGQRETLYQENSGFITKVKRKTGVDPKQGCTYHMGCDPSAACSLQ